MTWDDDSDDENAESENKPKSTENTDKKASAPIPTILEPHAETAKSSEPRRSDDRASRPDSDTSYDIVSGTTSQAPGSPKEDTKPSNAKKDEDSEDDWE